MSRKKYNEIVHFGTFTTVREFKGGLAPQRYVLILPGVIAKEEVRMPVQQNMYKSWGTSLNINPTPIYVRLIFVHFGTRTTLHVLSVCLVRWNGAHPGTYNSGLCT